MASPGPREAPPLGAQQRLAAGKKKLEEYKMRKKPNKTPDVAMTSKSDVNISKSPDFELPPFKPNIVDQQQAGFVHNNINGKINLPDPISFFQQIDNNHTDSKVQLSDVLSQNQQQPQSNVIINGNNGNFHIENKNEESAEESLSITEAIKLKQQLQFHMQTVEFLVSEKNSLTMKANDLESSITNLQKFNDDINGRLNISRHRASCLELENSNLKEKMDEMGDRLNACLQENNKYKETESSYLNQCSELKEELQESKLMINSKVSENIELKKQIEELTYHINASELRFQQLNQGFTQMQNNPYVEQNQILARQLEDLNKQMKDLESEKNQSNSQYQQYVQQLNNQLESTSQKHEALLLENENLMNRESNLIQQMDSLEKQLQGMLASKPDFKAKEVNEEQTNQMEVVLKEMEEQNQNLKSAMEEKENMLQAYLGQLKISQNYIEELTSIVGMMQSEKTDIVKLNAAIESDRIAAQKATTQNTKLKSELESLQEAYKKMTESKLELAELLQAEKNLSRTLTLTLADNEEKLKETNIKLFAKDEEMIRLQAESSMLEREALKHNHSPHNCNEHDHHNHSNDEIKQELEIAYERLKEMNENNDKLNQIIVNHGIPISKEVNEEIGDKQIEVEIANEVVVEPSNVVNVTKVKNENCKHIPATEAMRKLQDRFTKLMDDMANLSDDKQRLEHLVLQLQGETETIGEYIALYQKQRSILKQREYEKDIQLNQLAQEKEQLKGQLDQLGALVEQLIKENIEAHSKVNSDQSTEQQIAPKDTAQTAAQINNLLTEIKENHLVESNQANNLLDNFQPCSWCSGKLITI